MFAVTFREIQRNKHNELSNWCKWNLKFMTWYVTIETLKQKTGISLFSKIADIKLRPHRLHLITMFISLLYHHTCLAHMALVR